MTITILLPLLICLGGLLLYVLPVDGKLQTLGLNMFWVGLLAFLLIYPHSPVKLP
jgi:hypothetical protein